MEFVGGSQRCVSESEPLVDQPMVDVVRREHGQAAVVMLAVVPGEEVATETAGMLEAAEALRKVGPELERLEVRFGVRVVVGHVWSRMGLGDALRSGVP